VIGAVALGAASAGPCIEVLRRTGGKVLAMASTPVSLDGLAGRRRLFPAMIPTFSRIGLTMGLLMLRARRAGIRAAFVWGSSLRDDQLGERLWGEVLPGALESGVIRAIPEPMLMGEGLGGVQAALDRQRSGVSARKIVVPFV
jgi:formyltetrahydrofolate deformylase